jgi:hypothetical protein
VVLTRLLPADDPDAALAAGGAGEQAERGRSGRYAGHAQP